MQLILAKNGPLRQEEIHVQCRLGTGLSEIYYTTIEWHGFFLKNSNFGTSLRTVVQKMYNKSDHNLVNQTGACQTEKVVFSSLVCNMHQTVGEQTVGGL